MFPWDKLEKELPYPIIDKSTVSGGCIHQSYRIVLENKEQFFLKYNTQAPPHMFTVEAKGLEELAKRKVIRIPKVKLFGKQYLVLEWIHTSSKNKNFYYKMGKVLAKLHKSISNKEKKVISFGWDQNNYIGSLLQSNKFHKKWKDFWIEERIKPQKNMASNMLSERIQKLFTQVEKNMDSLLGESTLEAPAPIHGDLWGGNHLCDEKNDPVLVDPAFYYGHREADLAMTTMFSSYPKDFYKGYEEEYPLLSGFWKKRVHIYLLYHQLSHLNHFGSAYLASIQHSLEQLLS